MVYIVHEYYDMQFVGSRVTVMPTAINSTLSCTWLSSLEVLISGYHYVNPIMLLGNCL